MRHWVRKYKCNSEKYLGRFFVSPWTVAHQTPLSMGILQARILEWIAMPSSTRSSQPRDQTQVSCIAGGFFTIWVTREPYECWSGQPIPSPRELPNPRIELRSSALQVDPLPAELLSPRKITVTLKLVNTYWALTCSRQFYRHTHICHLLGADIFCFWALTSLNKLLLFKY